MKIFFAIALLALTAGCEAPQAAPSTLESDRIVREAANASNAEKLRLETEFVQLNHGDRDAVMYHRCKTIPPTVKANQEACARLIARTERELAAQPAW
jgi:hypothetical protein